MSDFRTQYFLEAQANIREANKLDVDDQEYWALLICAIGNATMAAVSDTVAKDVVFLTTNRQAKQKAVQKGIKGNLRAK